MTTLLLAVITAALLVLLALFWRQASEARSVEATQQEDARISPLLRGLNYLLSDEPDRALQEMVQVARLRTEAADVYMALGEMFRAKGEIGRAVRIHQNILARPDVSAGIRLQAHFALAKDFQTGGLLDRALRQYEKVLALQPDHEAALMASMRIREQSHEWSEAEALLSRLEQMRRRKMHLHRAYLFAEMAANALEQNDYARAEGNVESALLLDRHCAHAWLLQIRLDLLHDRFDEASKHLQEMMHESPEYVSLLIRPLLAEERHYQALEPQFIEFWQQQHDEHFALDWLEALATSKDPSSMQALRQQLGFEPASLRGSLRLSALADDGSALARQAKLWRMEMKGYACSECGVRVGELRWQCPQCHEWGTMHAVKEGGV